LPGEDYLAVLARVHAHLKPATYVEVGVAKGGSLRLLRPETRAIAIDPDPRLETTLPATHKLFVQPSDEFFAHHDVMAELGGRAVKMAFIDGMHHFDFALRDFINLERVSDRDSLIFVHDCFPIDARSATREQATKFWSGDVWRLIVLLKRHRPDLTIRTIAAPPTGLGLITHLDPQSRRLEERLPALIEEGLAIDFSTVADRKPEAFNLISNDWQQVRALIDARH